MLVAEVAGMRRIRTVAFAPALVVSTLAAPVRAGLQDDVDQAAAIVERFRDLPEKSIPDAVLHQARGLAILTVVKAGFGFSAQGGKGLVIARTDSGWSGPSAIGTGGAGFGLQIGIEVSELVIVLNTPDAVRAFAHGGNVSIGADLSGAAGPIGRDLGAHVLPVAAVYTYSRSQGLFVGLSLQGALLAARDDANREYYGKPVTPGEILSGRIAPPDGAGKLLRALQGF